MEIGAEIDFELLAPTPLALVCFRYRPTKVASPAELDSVNERIVKEINDSGAAYLTHTKLNGVYAIRISIGQAGTKQHHVKNLWSRVKQTARGIRLVV